jgi:Spy/CpxP family protein refolding chaperone
MKTNRITTSILAIVLLIGMSLSASAQRGQRGHGYENQNPGQRFNQAQDLNQNRQFAGNCANMQLNEEQQTQIKNLRLGLTEKNLPLRNDLRVMRATMQGLRTGDNQSLKDISNLIDDMSGVQVQIRKNAAEHRLAVRALLTDDQKIMFDARQGRKMNKGNKGNKGNHGNSKRGGNRTAGFGFNR